MALSSKREARRRASGSRISRHQSYNQLSPAYDSLPNVSFGAVHDICTPQHLRLELIANVLKSTMNQQSYISAARA
jgi:hypothetical protein